MRSPGAEETGPDSRFSIVATALYSILYVLFAFCAVWHLSGGCVTQGQRAPHRCAPCSRAAPRVLLPMKTAMGLLIAHSNPESVLSAPGAVYISRHGRGVAETRLAPVSTLPRPGAPEEDPARPSSECLSASYGPVSLMAMQPVTPALHFTLLPFILRVEVGRRSCRIDPRRKNPSFFGIKVCLGSTHASTLSIQPLQFNFSNILCDSLLDEHR